MQSLSEQLRADTSKTAVSPDQAYEIFENWVRREKGLELYPAQEEAALELSMGAHVILATPTGSGKSLVALAAHTLALAAGEKTVYTAPIKALVSEKFFDLVDTFGADRVGMITGDVSVNPDADIICCTAEIVAQIALRDPTAGNIKQVVMDEFHYYGDPDRGWAWQVPLLLMNDAQFLLLSATLGDVTELANDLKRRTGKDVALVTGVERPVPLSFRYEVKTVHESIEKIREAEQTPVYIVHFAQAQAVETAQALSSLKLITRPERDEIAEAIGDFRFGAGFGASLSRLVRSGIGVHHAGMLPKYRRLVEQLAQKGLLRVICGTDTLGVGINVPIRTVMFTALTKFDGEKMRQLSAREFHQIAGRAGRAGFDPEGDVVVLAPEHEVENLRATEKAKAKPGKKKTVKKHAPKGFVTWGEGSMSRLIAAEPEPLVSQMKVTHSLVLQVIARGEKEEGEALKTMRTLVFDSHEPKAKQYEHARTALQIFRTLKNSGVVEIVKTDAGAKLLRPTIDLQPSFALNQPLSPFALAAIELIEPDSPEYVLDVISVIEATLENPRAILREQEHRARGEAIAAMKAEGIEYEERMERVEEVTYPKPLEELLGEAFDAYTKEVPWARDYELSPKSIVRDMIERAFNFRDLVSFYGLGRSEGVVLRYLSDAYKALSNTVPPTAKTDELEEIIVWLGELVRQVDSSLLDEWEALQNPETAEISLAKPEEFDLGPPVTSLIANERAFKVMVRNALWQRVQAAAFERYDSLRELDSPHFVEARWREALDEYYAEHDAIEIDAEARSAKYCEIETTTDHWRFRQVLVDPDNNLDWAITGIVNLAESEETGEPVIVVQNVSTELF
ncbi:MAG TPA: DUF3516 domain-containing protein [Microbacteriaceae bacterium]|nr:DUF3516 domain-containing protein [Microbacteriaceae bacterium]